MGKHLRKHIHFPHFLKNISREPTIYSNCFLNSPVDTPVEFQNANYSLTGQIFNPNDQCKITHRGNASFCQVN